MEGQTGDTGVLDEPARGLEALDAARLERRAQLDRDREAGALGGGARDGDRRVGVADQGGARARLHHLRHRAAHVEVDEVRAALGGHGGGGAHDLRVLAEELDRDRPARALVGVDDEQLVERLAVAVVDRVARDHLADREAGAVALGLEPHEPVADPGQRREHDPVRDRDPAELPRVMEASHTDEDSFACQASPLVPRARLRRRYVRLRSWISRSPVSVSMSSTSSIRSQNGTIAPARPPVAIDSVSSPSSSRTPPDDPVDLRGEAEDHARADRLDRRLADQRARRR